MVRKAVSFYLLRLYPRLDSCQLFLIHPIVCGEGSWSLINCSWSPLIHQIFMARLPVAPLHNFLGKLPTALPKVTYVTEEQLLPAYVISVARASSWPWRTATRWSLFTLCLWLGQDSCQLRHEGNPANIVSVARTAAICVLKETLLTWRLWLVEQLLRPEGNPAHLTSMARTAASCARKEILLTWMPVARTAVSFALKETLLTWHRWQEQLSPASWRKTWSPYVCARTAASCVLKEILLTWYLWLGQLPAAPRRKSCSPGCLWLEHLPAAPERKSSSSDICGQNSCQLRPEGNPAHLVSVARTAASCALKETLLTWRLWPEQLPATQWRKSCSTGARS